MVTEPLEIAATYSGLRNSAHQPAPATTVIASAEKLTHCAKSQFFGFISVISFGFLGFLDFSRGFSLDFDLNCRNILGCASYVPTNRISRTGRSRCVVEANRPWRKHALLL